MQCRIPHLTTYLLLSVPAVFRIMNCLAEPNVGFSMWQLHEFRVSACGSRMNLGFQHVAAA